MGDVVPFRPKARDDHRGCPSCTFVIPTSNILAMTTTGRSMRCPRCGKHEFNAFKPVQYWAPWPPPVLE